MNKHLEDAVSGLARITLGTMSLAMFATLCVAAHLTASGSAGDGASASTLADGRTCSCCNAETA